MRRRTVLAQLLVFGVITVAILAYTVFGLLGVKVVNRPYHVTVHLTTGGGIFSGAEVAYRGVQVGTVDSVTLGTDGVTLNLAIDHGTRIPADSIANIYDLSAVGEQYVDLVPQGTTDSYLSAGSVIPPARTTTPLQTATVLYDLEQFISSINAQDLQVIGTEGAAAFGGAGEQLKSILADSTTIVAQLMQTSDATGRLLKNSATLLKTAAAHSGDFDAFAAALRSLSDTLASSTPTINTFLQQAAPTTQLVDTLIRQNGSALGVLLGNLASFSSIQVARLPGLKALLVAVPEFGQLAPQIVEGDALRGVLNFNLNEPLCQSGVPLSNPLSGTRTPLKAVQCTAVDLARGAANAPRPAGSSGTDSATATALAVPSATTTSDPAMQVGAFDASSGLVSTSSGTLLRLGMDGGQQELLGDKSWEAMLLALTGS